MKLDRENKMVSFEGEVRWASVPPNKPRGPSPEYTTDTNRSDLSYSIEVECSESDFRALAKEYKLPKLMDIKEDENGKTFIRVKASKVKTNVNPAKNDGEDFVFKDIPVINTDGTQVDVPIANGSQGLVRAALIETRNGHTLRLLGVMIKDLIAYQASELFDDVVEQNPHAEAEVHDLSNQLESLEDKDDFGF